MIASWSAAPAQPMNGESAGGLEYVEVGDGFVEQIKQVFAQVTEGLPPWPVIVGAVLVFLLIALFIMDA